MLLAQAYASPYISGPIYSRAGVLGVSTASFEFAPASGLGMGTQCACGSITGAKAEVVVSARSSVGECASNDGQSLTKCAIDAVRVSSGLVDVSTLGVWVEPSRTNDALWARDLSNAAWSKTTMTCAHTANGMRGGDANGATTCTATAANGTVIQAIVFTSSAQAASVFIKRRTGTGEVDVTRDGTTWIRVDTSLSASIWKRIVAQETAGCTSSTAPSGSNCVIAAGLSGTAANASIGIRIVTNGDAVDVDFAQEERSVAGDTTSPIETTSAAATRSTDLVDVTISPSLPTSFCASATYVGSLPGGNPRYHGVPGSGAPGVAGGSGSYCDSYGNNADTSASSPGAYTSGLSTVTPVMRFTTYHTGALLNLCINGVCGAGLSATWAAPTWTRYRLGTYAAGNGEINGVQREVQLDPDPTKCRRTIL